MLCRETHDRPKGEIKCCSILDPGDPLYHKNFTTCRAKMVGEECQYICSNEMASGQDGLPARAVMGVTPMVVAATEAAAPPQGAQPGTSGKQPMATDDHA